MTDAATPGRLKVLQQQMGVTRLADITGLDTAGIPVVQAVRPFSKSNAVSQGKGATLGDAARSALMESAESFCAERIERYAVTVASAAALGLPAEAYCHHADPAVHPGWREWDIAWVMGTNLLDGSAVPVPLELVHTAYVVPPPDHDGVFRTSTTGLAASSSYAQAVRHGLLECIERDAIARALVHHGFLHDRRIDPYTVQSPELHDLVNALCGRGFLAGLWLAPAAGGIPAVWCHLMEDCGVGQAILPNPAEGSAARTSVAAAAIAAIHEAAQSRLTVISGARDDIGRNSYRNPRCQARRDAHRRLLREGPATVQCSEPDGNHGDDAMADITWLLSRLRDSGITAVCEVRLETDPMTDLHAVKIIVPELQPLLEG